MRALVIVLDSVGIGNAPDAANYGDEGANTLGHIFEQVPDLRLPNLFRLGLENILDGDASQQSKTASASYGRMQERSAGKDTTTGHWEIAGVLVKEPFTVFESFPDELVTAIARDTGVKFIGNYACSGTVILEQLGAEHVRTGNPILYTSADSVLQIAAHEKILPLERLYEICKVARHHADAYRIGRVIARPFDGSEGRFKRTANRHDYSLLPPRTVLNAILDIGLPVIGIGKIHDIFGGQGITESHPTSSNRDGMEKIDKLWGKIEHGLIFVNLVDFDMVFGHRRNTKGYAGALLEFDAWLGQFLPEVKSDDLVILTADHGNDPTFRGSDHTREQVPLLVIHRGRSDDLGTRNTYADIAASLAQFFQTREPWPVGTSFLPQDAARLSRLHSI